MTQFEKVARALYAKDPLCAHFGIQLCSVSQGHCQLEMLVQPFMLSGFGLGHGGITYTLANAAFAFACNGYNQKTLNLTSTMHYLTVVHQGDVLTATAVELSRRGRTGVYDVNVVNQAGETVALFRGTTYQTRDKLFDEMALEGTASGNS